MKNKEKKEQITRDIMSMTQEQIDSYRWAIQYSKALHKQDKLLIGRLLDQREKFLLAGIQK